MRRRTYRSGVMMFFRRTVWKQMLLAASLVSAVTQAALGQANSWLKPGSGSWEEPVWSLGVLPGPGQSVMITNEGWKAVMISPTTSQNYPQTLTVNSVTLSSPPDSHNTLLLNYAGQQSPLTVNSFVVSSNTAVTMLESGLLLNGPNGSGMSIGGEFNQDQNSLVMGNQLDTGWLGPGVYNLKSGTLGVGHAWVGGPLAGVFNQTGGTNLSGIVHLEPGGEYNLVNGDFGANVYFDGNALFRQQGGRLNSGLAIWRGTYLLENGENRGGLLVPVSDGFSASNGGASVIQTGGTNWGALTLGYYGAGSYVLSNGVSIVSDISVGQRGSVQQWGGSQTVTGGVVIITDYRDRGVFGAGTYDLVSGTLSAASLEAGGPLSQEGGTNIIAGDLIIDGVYGAVNLSGGLLTSENTTLYASWVGGFVQSGGQNIIRNQLTVFENNLPFWQGFVLDGGELVVSNIVLNSGGKFTKNSGFLAQSGVLRLVAGRVYAGEGSHQFGPVSLESASEQVNSSLYLPVSNACVVRFRDSSAQPWSSTARFTIENWTGSTTGRGEQQVFFGTSAAGLSLQQLSQIAFHNPPRLPAGTYSATILGTGEVAPDVPPPTGFVPLRLAKLSDGTMQISLNGDPGANYGIERSTNLIDWNFWTNQANGNGTLSIVDLNATNVPQRFYRAILMP